LSFWFVIHKANARDKDLFLARTVIANCLQWILRLLVSPKKNLVNTFANMPTGFAGVDPEKRRRMFLYVCIPVRILLYSAATALLWKFPHQVGIIIGALALVGLMTMFYQAISSPAWWYRWPQMVLLAGAGAAGVMAAVTGNSNFALFIAIAGALDLISAAIMYNTMFE
jgi:hypothetical protein